MNVEGGAWVDLQYHPVRYNPPAVERKDGRSQGND